MSQDAVGILTTTTISNAVLATLAQPDLRHSDFAGDVKLYSI